MNTKTMRKAARDLVPGDVLYVGEGKSRLVVLYPRMMGDGSIELTLGTIGEFGASNQVETHPADSQFTVEIPSGLTPVQAASGHLLNAARDVLKQAREGRPLDLGFLQGAVDELDPPKPPTLEEAIAALDLLTKAAGTDCLPEALEVSRKLLKRVPD